MLLLGATQQQKTEVFTSMKNSYRTLQLPITKYTPFVTVATIEFNMTCCESNGMYFTETMIQT